MKPPAGPPAESDMSLRFMEILVKICEHWMTLVLVSYHLLFFRFHKGLQGLHLKSLASTSGEEFRSPRWCRIVNTSSPARTSRSPFSCALVEVQDDDHPDIAAHGIGRWAVVSVLQLSHKKKGYDFTMFHDGHTRQPFFCPHFQSQLCVRLDSINCKSEVLNIAFSIIYGMSSFPFTNSFFKMVIAPPTRHGRAKWSVFFGQATI